MFSGALALITGIFIAQSCINSCPPNPGSTVITRTRSTLSSRGKIISGAVAGLIETPALTPKDLIKEITASAWLISEHAS